MHQGRRTAALLASIATAWAAEDPAIAARWPALAQPATDRILRHAIARLAEGRTAVLLGTACPRPRLRGNRRLGAEHDATLRGILARLVMDHPHAVAAVLHRSLCDLAEARAIPAPGERWTRAALASLRDDRAFMHQARGGTRRRVAHGPYITSKRDVPPGAVYVVDHRQLDVECISEDGRRLLRPWLTLIVDQRTTLPVGWQLLDAAPDGDTVLDALAHAMRPKERNHLNAHLGAALSTVCGIPDHGWLFDNGKDFKTRRIDGVVIEGRAPRKASSIDRRDTERIERYVHGLLQETGASVRHAIPFNARAKIVERVFADMSRELDAMCPGHVGNKAGLVPARTRDMRARFAAEVRNGFAPEDLARATGHLTFAQLAERLEFWVWQRATRQDSRSAGLRHDGRTWAPIALWHELAPQRRVPSVETLARLRMEVEVRRVNRGQITIDGHIYGSAELLGYDGRDMVVRYSRTDRAAISVIGPNGDPWPRELLVERVVPISELADPATLQGAMRNQRAANRAQGQRVRALQADRVDPLAEAISRLASANAGALRSPEHAPAHVEVLDIRDHRVATPLPQIQYEAPAAIHTLDDVIREAAAIGAFFFRGHRYDFELQPDGTPFFGDPDDRALFEEYAAHRLQTANA